MTQCTVMPCMSLAMTVARPVIAIYMSEGVYKHRMMVPPGAGRCRNARRTHGDGRAQTRTDSATTSVTESDRACPNCARAGGRRCLHHQMAFFFRAGEKGQAAKKKAALRPPAERRR